MNVTFSVAKNITYWNCGVAERNRAVVLRVVGQGSPKGRSIEIEAQDHAQATVRGRSNQRLENAVRRTVEGFLL